MINVALFMCLCPRAGEVNREPLVFSALVIGEVLFHEEGDSNLVAQRMIMAPVDDSCFRNSGRLSRANRSSNYRETAKDKYVRLKHKLIILLIKASTV